MTDILDIKNKINLNVLENPKFASESGRVRDKMYSRHDAIRFPNPSSTSSPCFVLHSFRDCSDESCSFAHSEKLFFWCHHFEPVEMFAPAVYRGSLCAGRASCLGSNLLRIQLLWSFFVFFWNGHIHSSRFLPLHPSRKVQTSTRHSSVDTDLLSEWSALLTQYFLSPLRSE